MRIKIQAVSGEGMSKRLLPKYRKVLEHYGLQEKHRDYMTGIGEPDEYWDSSIELNSLQDIFRLKKQLGEDLIFEDDIDGKDELLIYDDYLD